MTNRRQDRAHPGSDISYPSVVWHNDLLCMSHHSTHEGETSIYLAKVKICT